MHLHHIRAPTPVPPPPPPTTTCSVLFKRPMSAVTSSFICCVGAFDAKDRSISSSISCCGLRLREGDGDLDLDLDLDLDFRRDDLEVFRSSFTVFTFSFFFPRPRVGDFLLGDVWGLAFGKWSLGCLAISSRSSLSSDRRRAFAFCAARSWGGQ